MTKTEFINNLRGVDNNEELSHEYIGLIYDSIEASPIELFDDKLELGNPIDSTSCRLAPMCSAKANGKQDLACMLKAMLKNVKTSEELLRGLAVHEYSFYTVKDFSKSMSYVDSQDDALSDLVQIALSTTWYHFHGLIQGSLNNADFDPQALCWSLDILKHAICATILLDMQLERKAFLTQLARVKELSKFERSGIRTQDQSFMGEDWYRELEVALSNPDFEQGNVDSISQIHNLFDSLYDLLNQDTRLKKEMGSVVRRIREGQFLLNDPKRYFIREGDLTKKGSKLGRSTTYHFFLFSDLLVYTKPLSTHNEYKILDEFPLYMTKIVDWFPPNKPKLKMAFSIHHPRKSLLVYCNSEQEKREWVRSIQNAILSQCQWLSNVDPNVRR